MECHLAPDHDPFRYRSGNARIVVSNSCSAFRERKHFIGTSAITICGNCHEDPTSSRKTAVGPKLEDIANLPSTTALSLKEFLGSRHKTRMPNFIVFRADTDDVIAYILSLKRK
jgi:cytochrome c553